MSTELVAASNVRALLLVWQNPSTRRFSKVARLQADGDGYRFEYLNDADDPAFEPLHSFPDKHHVYETRHLPAFFQNRVMSRKRDSFEQYAEWLGIDPSVDAPFEILARTGGGRATDTFHVVEEPQLAPGKTVTIRFFASGLSHVESALGRLLMVQSGDQLALRAEPDNPANPRALLIDVVAGEPVGWVPDWLLDEVHDLMNGEEFDLRVEKVNMDAPWHLKLLCRIDAICN